MALSILFRDDYYIAVHKPAGLLVHRSPISQDTRYLLQTLRDQIGRRVYPVHRLDRATSGLILFGLTSEAARVMADLWEGNGVEKRYWALARGWLDDSGHIDHAVRDEDGNGIPKAAVTDYRCLARVELDVAVDRYPTSRYSLAEVWPGTGRRQQIRKHFKHISHHLIGDTTHGNGKHNRFFRSTYGINRLMLLSQSLAFRHPYSDASMRLTAEPELEWRQLADRFGWDWQQLTRAL